MRRVTRPRSAAGVLAVALAVTVVIVAATPMAWGGHAWASSPPPAGAIGPLPAIVSTFAPTGPFHNATDASLPSPIGAGPSAVLATLDLVNNSVRPGATNATWNAQSPIASAYDTGNQRLYVGAYDSNELLVVDAASRTTLGAIALPGPPVALVYDPAGHEIYVATGGSDSLTVIDDSLGTIVATVPIPSGVVNAPSSPGALVYNPLNHTILVAQSGGLTCCTLNISVVDGVTNQVVGVLPAGPDVIALALNAQSGLLYGLSAVAGTVTVDDVVTGAMSTNWSVAFAGTPTGITADPTDGLVYVGTTSFSDWANVTELSAAFGTIVHTITVYQAGAFFGSATPVYSSSTGKVFLSAGSVELFPITANTGVLGPGSAIGSCVGPVALTGSGAPMVAVDACADSLLWLDGITGALAHTTVVGADPTAVAQVPGSGIVAVAEYRTQRIDLLDGATLAAFQTIAMPFGEFPTALATDARTGWVYGIDGGFGATSVTAYDPISGATMWSSPCNGCWLDGIADANGTIRVSSADTQNVAEVLYTFNATTGATSAATPVASLPVLPIYTFTLGGVVALPNSTTVIVSVPLASEVVALNGSSGQLLWSRPTGTGAGPVALVEGTGLIALGAGNGSGSVEFVNASSGAWVGSVALPAPPTSITTGSGGSEVYVLDGGSVYRVSFAGSGIARVVPTPSGADLAGVFYLAGSGGVAVPSRSDGAVLWIGATLNLSTFGAVGPTVQGEPLTLDANVSGGFGAYSVAFTGLPYGCVAANVTNLTCLPLDAGPFTVGVTVNDSTGLPGATAATSVVLSKYPLLVNITTVSGTPYTGGAVAFAAALNLSEVAVASYLNYSWSLAPSTAGTLNRTNASTVLVAFTAAGTVSLALTAELGGTSVVTYSNFTVGTLGAPTPLLGLSNGTWTLVLIALAVVVVIGGAIGLVARSRRPRAPDPSESEDDSTADAMPPEDDAAATAPTTPEPPDPE